MKKFWFAFFLLCLALGSFKAFATSDEKPESAPLQPLLWFQTIGADSKTSRTIVWSLEPPTLAEASYLEYKDPTTNLVEKVTGEPYFISTAEGELKFYCVKLNNLRPDTKYQYRIRTVHESSEWRTLATAPLENQPFSALIFGDSQSTDYKVWRQTASRAYQAHPDAAFFINMGDLVDNGAQFDQWKSWFAGANALFSTIPIAPLSGNHENYSLQWKFSPATLYLSLFPLPENGAPNLKQQTYSFEYGAAHFVVLDTQAEEMAAYDPNLIEKQLQWLENDLQTSTKKWKIVLMHRGPFSYPDVANLNELGEAFVPIFDKAGVDVVFTAHIHTYGRTVPLRAALPSTPGSVYISTGRSGDKVWEDSLEKPFEAVFDAALDQPNYLTLSISEHQLQVQAFKQDGQKFDDIILKK